MRQKYTYFTVVSAGKVDQLSRELKALGLEPSIRVNSGPSNPRSHVVKTYRIEICSRDALPEVARLGLEEQLRVRASALTHDDEAIARWASLPSRLRSELRENEVRPGRRWDTRTFRRRRLENARGTKVGGPFTMCTACHRRTSPLWRYRFAESTAPSFLCDHCRGRFSIRRRRPGSNDAVHRAVFRKKSFDLPSGRVSGFEGNPLLRATMASWRFR